MRVALDSNILLYLVGIARTDGDRGKAERLRRLIESLVPRATVLCPLQTFGETYRVMQRSGRSRDECRRTLFKWRDEFEILASSEAAYWAAFDLATEHKLQFWDALIISVAAEAGCTILLSEDMQSGFAWRGIKVVNPLADRLDERLSRLLDAPV